MTFTLASRIVAVAAIGFTIGACAKHPDSIAATYVSQSTYRGLGCSELAQESMRLNSILSRASNQQENARTNDAIGILLIGIPVSSLSGDNIAAEIARLKGEQEALNRRMLEMRCEGDASEASARPAMRRSNAAPRSPIRRAERTDFDAPRVTVSVDDLPARVRTERRPVDVHKVMMHTAAE